MDHEKGFDLIRAVNSKGLYKSSAKQFILKGCKKKYKVI